MLELSNLPKTWIIDIDGTILKHNGYLTDGYDTILGGVKEFFGKIDKNDKILLLTARNEKYLPKLKAFLSENNIRYDYILTDMPVGERILVNDKKPSGLVCAYAFSKERDSNSMPDFNINEEV